MQDTQSIDAVTGSFNTLFLITDFFRFWFWVAPIGIIKYFSSLNAAFLKLFSFWVVINTFFKPWKNEYREGLVEFSVAMGMFFKSIIIVIDCVLFLILLALEILCVGAFVLWPFATLAVLFL